MSSLAEAHILFLYQFNKIYFLLTLLSSLLRHLHTTL